MSKINVNRVLSQQYDRANITDVIRTIAQQVNGLSEGVGVAHYQRDSVAPTGSAVSYAQGDFRWNKQPAEAGSAGSKYVTFGWICVADGSPGTWLDCRFLTGN